MYRHLLHERATIPHDARRDESSINLRTKRGKRTVLRMQPFQQLLFLLSRHCRHSGGLIGLSRGSPNIRTTSSRKVCGRCESKGITVTFDATDFCNEFMLISIQGHDLVMIEQTDGKQRTATRTCS